MSSPAAGKAAIFVAKIALAANFAESSNAAIGAGKGKPQQNQGVAVGQQVGMKVAKQFTMDNNKSPSCEKEGKNDGAN